MSANPPPHPRNSYHQIHDMDDDTSSNSSSESIAPSVFPLDNNDSPEQNAPGGTHVNAAVNTSSQQAHPSITPIDSAGSRGGRASGDAIASSDKYHRVSSEQSSTVQKSPLASSSSSSTDGSKPGRNVRFPSTGPEIVRPSSDADPHTNTTSSSSSSSASSKKRPTFIPHLPTHLIPKQIKQMISSPLSSPPIGAETELTSTSTSTAGGPSAEGHRSVSTPTLTVTTDVSPDKGNEEDQEDYFSPRPSSKPMSDYFPSDDNLSRQTWQNTMYNRDTRLPDDVGLPVYPRASSPDYDSSGISTPRSRTSMDLLTQPSRAKLPSLGSTLFHPNAGMAPGMQSYMDEGDDPEKSHQLPQAYSADSSIEDIPLRRLDTKLREIKKRAEMSQAAEHAEKLVRNYTRGPKRDRRHTHQSKNSANNHQSAPAAGTQNASAGQSPATSTDSVSGDTGFIVENTRFLDSEDSLNDHLTDTNETLFEEPHHEDYVAPPSHVKLGVLGTLLTMYNQDNGSLPTTPGGSPTPVPSTPDIPRSGRSSPKLHRPKLHGRFPSYEKSAPKWYQHKRAKSANSLSNMVLSASQTLAAPGMHGDLGMGKHIHRSHLAQKRKNKIREQIQITVHIADVLQRQRFILRMCKALMLFGAPTHRLEEYMKMTSRVLEIDGQFLYIPGCMLCSFGDSTTHTSEMRLVRVAQGLNLSHLHEAHIIYKEVVHDVIGVEEASSRLDDLLKKKNLYPRWVCTIAFGLASAFFALLSFGGTWVDFPISFVLGGCVGFLQIWIAPRSALYSNVFEVTSSIIVSFLGRAFGSIGKNKDTFCFAAIAQGSLALILPGYTILCGSLELQSKNIVSGAVRMFYAVIYSLFLGFGITLGAVIYGWIDRSATSSTSCSASLTPWLKFFFLPGATCFIAMVNQARVRELPVMTVLSGIGYVVTYFLNKKLPGAKQFSSAIAAFGVGIFGNIYSRVGHGLAFSAMLPAIFVLVPGGIAAQGSLVSGIKSADEIISNSSDTSEDAYSTNTAMNLGINMIQVSVGITVGLFVATLFIYPFGKKRSGLFTF